MKDHRNVPKEDPPDLGSSPILKTTDPPDPLDSTKNTAKNVATLVLTGSPSFHKIKERLSQRKSYSLNQVIDQIKNFENFLKDENTLPLRAPFNREVAHFLDIDEQTLQKVKESLWKSRLQYLNSQQQMFKQILKTVQILSSTCLNSCGFPITNWQSLFFK